MTGTRLDGVRMLASIAAVLVSVNPTAAEELRSVDPKTVIDGDTFYVSVRVLDIDAPEQGEGAKCDAERALAERAKDRARELLHGRVTLDVQGVDAFGRLLATVRVEDGRELGQVLLRENLARPYRRGQRPNWCG